MSRGVRFPSLRTVSLASTMGEVVTNYARMYRLGITPWERYWAIAAESIATRLDRVTADRDPGRVDC